MTIAEMKSSFNTQYDAATSFAAPAWDDADISNFLNIAQDIIVEEIFASGNLSLISNIVTSRDILTLHRHPVIENANYIILSSITDFLYYVASKTNLTRTNPTANSTTVPNEKISRDNYNKFIKNGFNNPWFKYPKVFLEDIYDTTDRGYRGNCLVILTDAYTTPLWGEVTYVKYPTRMNITTNTSCVLNLALHREIVKRAVEEAVKAIKIAKTSAQ